MDTKAAFALTIESAALALTTTLSFGPSAVLGHLRTGALTLLATGTSLIGLAILLAMLVVAPRMKGSQARRLSPSDFIYFGHVRHWDPERLVETLREADPLPALSRQLVVISKVAWRKHRCMQLSLLAAAAGTVFIALAALLAP
ncbi:DUF5706 domain-containing protein [Streptomyces sp. NBC_01142]|uniref:Pycsar system effector family protein n=1 Tax=Streptomyces sp. NBC_01142 TaxID=2975865 RepID=UPI002250E9E9|nr:Pycsar system effector family protein [Streptomyces sp. NBC_01142]MCX4822180.1 DUF5706 domain-containing protein [Streptomyces sp. NBC_01142]